MFSVKSKADWEAYPDWKQNEAPVATLPKPEHFTARPTKRGMVSLNVRPVPGALAYRFEYRPAGETQWTAEVHTQTNVLITGLQRGNDYQFRVAGMGAARKRVYSNIQCCAIR